MLPKMEYFDSGKRDILDVILHGSGKGFEESKSVQKTFETAKKLRISVVMFNFPYIDRKEKWHPKNSYTEETESLKEILVYCKANKYKKIRLVGKSLGGIVAANYLKIIHF